MTSPVFDGTGTLTSPANLITDWIALDATNTGKLSEAVTSWCAGADPKADPPYSTSSFVVLGDIQSWNVAAVTDMSELFDSKLECNPTLTGWDTGSVTTARQMFSFTQFNNGGQPLVFDSSSLQSIEMMFYYADKMTQTVTFSNISSLSDCSQFAWNSPVGFFPLKPAWLENYRSGNDCDPCDVNGESNQFRPGTSTAKRGKTFMTPFYGNWRMHSPGFQACLINSNTPTAAPTMVTLPAVVKASNKSYTLEAIIACTAVGIVALVAIVACLERKKKKSDAANVLPTKE